MPALFSNHPAWSHYIVYKFSTELLFLSSSPSYIICNNFSLIKVSICQSFPWWIWKLSKPKNMWLIFIKPFFFFFLYAKINVLLLLNRTKVGIPCLVCWQSLAHVLLNCLFIQLIYMGWAYSYVPYQPGTTFSRKELCLWYRARADRVDGQRDSYG